MGKAGYLIPENSQPDSLDCLMVFYPSDPLYLAALLGSLTFLGTWVAWENDPDKRARLAAAAWKQANECTLDTMGCIDELTAALAAINATLAGIQTAIENQSLTLDTANIETAITGVQAAIENQSLTLDTANIETAITGVQTAIENLTFDSVINEDDMSIVINNCCCCGCNGNSSTGGNLPDGIDPIVSPPETEQLDDTLSPFATVTEDHCALAHFYALSWRNTLLRLADGSLSASNFTESFNDVWAGVPATIANWVVEIADALLALMAFFGLLNGYNTQIASEIDSKIIAIKCAMLNRSLSVQERQAAVYTLIDTMALGSAVRYAAKLVFSYLPIGSIFNSNLQSVISGGFLPAWAYTAGCPSCVNSQPIDPLRDVVDETGTYELVNVTADCWAEWDPTSMSTPGEVGEYSHHGDYMLLGGVTSDNTYGDGHRIDFIVHLADFVDSPSGYPLIFVCDYDNVDRVKFGATFKDPEMVTLLSSVIATKDNIIAKFPGLVDLAIIESDHTDQTLQYWPNTVNANETVSVKMVVYQVRNA